MASTIALLPEYLSFLFLHLCNYFRKYFSFIVKRWHIALRLFKYFILVVTMWQKSVKIFFILLLSLKAFCHLFVRFRVYQKFIFFFIKSFVFYIFYYVVLFYYCSSFEFLKLQMSSLHHWQIQKNLYQQFDAARHLINCFPFLRLGIHTQASSLFQRLYKRRIQTFMINRSCKNLLWNYLFTYETVSTALKHSC